MLDLTNLVWDTNPTNTKGTAGTFLKAYQNNLYYKLSSGNISIIFGHEAVNEVIVSDLLSCLGIPHLKYSGSVAKISIRGTEHITFVCWSKEFKRPEESKMKFDVFYQINANNNETVYEFINRFGMIEAFNYMILTDFLIINRDRHSANIEILYKDYNYRVAPIYDNGVSFVAPLQNDLERVASFNALTDVPVNNWTGSFSLFTDLQYISKPVLVNAVTKKDITDILTKYRGLISDIHLLKTQEIIWERYNYAKSKKILCTG